MLTEKDLEFELLKQVELTNATIPQPRRMSAFAHHYLEAYKRCLPDSVLFVDVRENVNDAFIDVCFMETADQLLPWAAIHVYFEHMLLPRLSDANGSRKDIRKLLNVPEAPAPPECMRNPTSTKLYFADTFFAKLRQSEEDQLIGMMEDLFQASDKGFGAMLSRNREVFVNLLRVTQFFFKAVYDDGAPGDIGAFLGVVNAGYFLHIDGDLVLRHLQKAVVRT